MTSNMLAHGQVRITYRESACSGFVLAQYGDYMVLRNLAAKQAPKKGDAELLELSSMGKPEKLANKFERDTWPELERLARDLPEAGIHFQGQAV